MKTILIMASLLIAGTATAQCVGGNCYTAPAYPIAVYAPPQIVYQPRVVYQPYQYRGSIYTEKHYPTPWRDFWFGRGYSTHYYTPIQQPKRRK